MILSGFLEFGTGLTFLSPTKLLEIYRFCALLLLIRYNSLLNGLNT